jgi:hypothetical protein
MFMAVFAQYEALEVFELDFPFLLVFLFVFASMPCDHGRAPTWRSVPRHRRGNKKERKHDETKQKIQGIHAETCRNGIHVFRIVQMGHVNVPLFSYSGALNSGTFTRDFSRANR